MLDRMCRMTRFGLRAPRRELVGVAVALLLVWSGAAVAQAQESSMAELRAQLEEVFDVLPLSDGWALRPLDPEAGFRAIEVTGSELAIDGTAVSRDEVRARLGDLAGPVIAFSDLAIEDRESLLRELEPSASEDAELERLLVEEAQAAEEEGMAALEERKARRERRDVNRTDAQIVVGSSVTIEADEVTRDVLVVGGSLTSYGLIKGDAVAVGGPAEIHGEVTGDVAAIGGAVTLEPGSRVEGDVVSIGGSVDRKEGAVVEGEIQEVPFLPALKIGGWKGPDVSVEVKPVRSAFSFAWKLFGLAVLFLLAALTLLIAQRPVERVGERVADEPWKSGLVGLLCQILFFPLLFVLVVILVISIVGIPFLLLLPFAVLALVLIGLLGYTAVALRVGRWSEERFGWSFASPFLALLVGIGLLEVWSLLGELLGVGPGPIKFFAVMFAIFGGLVAYAAWTVGFGGAVLSRFGTVSSWSDGGSGGSRAWQPGVDESFSVSEQTPMSETFEPDAGTESVPEWPSPEQDPEEPRG